MVQSTARQIILSDWEEILQRRSFIELDARQRVYALIDKGSGRELCDPFNRIASPWLEPQGIVPQEDDGVIVVCATIVGQPVVIISIEQKFQGGGIGEVSGTKISQALRMATNDSCSGIITPAILLLESGGVRLQEANLGLAAIAEICDALLQLRNYAQVISIIAGQVGCFGGMSIVAGLCSHIIITPEGRLGLNGPTVIEQEAGIGEFDSQDRSLIWSIDGGEQRYSIGLTDELINDDIDKLYAALTAALDQKSNVVRSESYNVLETRIASINPPNIPTPQELRQLWGCDYAPLSDVISGAQSQTSDSFEPSHSRGTTWIAALSKQDPTAIIPSVLRADDTDSAIFLSVVPDPGNPFYRARNGELGLTEALALTRAIRAIIHEDAHKIDKRPIIAIVDTPSQAYGRIEETVGLHQALACTVNAYFDARSHGHPVVTVIVGHAFSGAFLAHGLQSSRVLALSDPGVIVHAMGKEAAAKVTHRTPEELDKLAATIIPMSYNVHEWAQLGICDGLLNVSNADAPTEDDILLVRTALCQQIQQLRENTHDLSYRLQTPGAVKYRSASRKIVELIAQQWNKDQ